MAAKLISFNTRALAELMQTEEVQAQVKIAADAIAATAKRDAPKDTGAGAQSIRAVKSEDGYRVGWDAEHAYMEYVELGTSTRKPRPFLRPAGRKVLGGR